MVKQAELGVLPFAYWKSSPLVHYYYLTSQIVDGLGTVKAYMSPQSNHLFQWCLGLALITALIGKDFEKSEARVKSRITTVTIITTPLPLPCNTPQWPLKTVRATTTAVVEPCLNQGGQWVMVEASRKPRVWRTPPISNCTHGQIWPKLQPAVLPLCWLRSASKGTRGLYWSV